MKILDLLKSPSILAPLLAAGAIACGSSDDTTSTAASVTSSSAAESSSAGTGGSGGTVNTGGGGAGGGTVAPAFVAKLDPTKGELPEGLFIDNAEAYVGLAVLGKVVKIDLPGGMVHDFGSIPPIPMNGGYMLGIVVDATGTVFVGFGGGDGSALKNGVYKIPAGGGAVTTPFATDPGMNFPNGLLLDPMGNLVVADSLGTIYEITSGGVVSTWKADPTLAGTDLSCKYAAPFPIGANGIVSLGGAYYVSNTNLGSIVKIAINNDGTAGAASVFAGPDCDALGGIDGIAIDADGTSILGVSNSQSKLVRIDASGKISTVFAGMPLDNPASISVAKVGTTTSAFITNSAFFDTTAPSPGLLGLALK